MRFKNEKIMYVVIAYFDVILILSAYFMIIKFICDYYSGRTL